MVRDMDPVTALPPHGVKPRVTVGGPLYDDRVTIDEARQRHAELSVQLTEHRRRYYLDDAPTVSDGEFDALMRELLAIEAGHPELVSLSLIHI